MESFFSWLLIGGAFVVFKMRRKAKLVEQRRQIEEISKSNTKKTKIANKSPVKKKTVTKPPLIISPRVSSKSRSPDWVPKYDGPMFAKPGEKSDLFSYASYIGAHKIDAPFSLIDFETSGFQPDYARILEVAVIKIDSQGNILDEYTTLINPEDGNVGRTDIHQITLNMVKKAPKISEIVGDLIKILDSSIIVAHNARFEENFLESAFRESGIKHPLMPTIDTLWLSRQVLKLPNYKLATVIEDFGYDFKDAHTAQGDVRAMARVLPEMLAMGKSIKFPSKLLKSPIHSATGKVVPRKANV